MRGGHATRREESLAVQSIILTAARTVGFALTFVIPILLVRQFSQTEFGIYKQVFLVSGTLIPILNLGLYASIFYFVPRDGGDGQRFILQAVALLGVTGALAAVGLLVAAEPLGRLFGAPEIRAIAPLLALLVLVSSPTEIFSALPVVDRRPMLAAYAMTANDLLRAAAIVGAALLFGTVRAVVWAAVAGALLRGAFMLWYLRSRRTEASVPPSRSELAAQLRYALPFAAAVLFEIGLTRFHEYFVAAHVTPAEFAIYAVGILQIPILGMLVQSVVEVMLIRGAEAFKNGDRAALRETWMTAVERLAAVLAPAWALALLLAPDLVGLLFGSSYLAAVPIFRIFTTTVLLWIIVDHGVLRATGDTGYLVKANAAGLATSIVVALLLPRSMVLVAGMAGYVAGLVVMRGLGVLKVAHRLGVPVRHALPWRRLAGIGAAIAVSIAAAWLVLTVTPPSTVLRLLVGGTVFAVTYLPLVVRFELVPPDEIRRVLGRFIPAYR